MPGQLFFIYDNVFRSTHILKETLYYFCKSKPGPIVCFKFGFSTSRMTFPCAWPKWTKHIWVTFILLQYLIRLNEGNFGAGWSRARREGWDFANKRSIKWHLLKQVLIWFMFQYCSMNPKQSSRISEKSVTLQSIISMRHSEKACDHLELLRCKTIDPVKKHGPCEALWCCDFAFAFLNSQCLFAHDVHVKLQWYLQAYWALEFEIWKLEIFPAHHFSSRYGVTACERLCIEWRKRQKSKGPIRFFCQEFWLCVSRFSWLLFWNCTNG